MTSIADNSIQIQTTSEPNFTPPSWFGEAVLISTYLRKHGVLSKITEHVRFARKRFGQYEVIDFLAVLYGYAISGERTLEEFYERLEPFAVPFMALFDRDRLPSRSAFSRFLAALTQEPVEALRTLFLDDVLARPLTHDKQTGGLVDRKGDTWTVFDIDGTREAARQRALPQTDELPAPLRRLDDVCAPGYRGRKRGEIVRTRTTVSQAHNYQWLGSFGNRGNGRYREELRKGLAAIGRYLAAYQLEASHTLLRLDGQYGNGTILSDVAGFAFVARGKDYHLLDHPLIQARLHLPPDQFQQRPESQLARSLYDCPQTPVGPEGVAYRVIVATHPAGTKKSSIGVTRAEVVYELFFTNLPQHAFTACDVVELYLHRGAFEPVLSDEASIRSCRPCPKREQCQWMGSNTSKPRQVSVLLHPLRVGPAPLLWRDWSRRKHRHACIQLVRHQRIEVCLLPATAASPDKAEVILSRAQRAHSRLSWQERLARNARVSTSGQVTIRLFGVPDSFAALFGWATA